MSPRAHRVDRGLTCEIVVEQTLGHVTHSKNLRRFLADAEGVEATFLPIPFEVEGLAKAVIGFQNWTVRAGVRARRAIRRARRERGHAPDVRFVHTQVPAVLLGRLLTDVPTVVSLDATPKQYDQLGEHYDHSVGSRTLERVKTALNRRCFDGARALVTWAHWTKGSLVHDYGVDADKITVIPPGVDTDLWSCEVPRSDDTVTRILFVGGDLRRKGGLQLMAAFEELRRRHGQRVELHLVTPAEVEPADGVIVHPRMTPNSPELIELYHRCDVFCLPTRGDCLPMVLPEAAAAGLALVATDVGAIGEIVRDRETGLLVPVDDVGAVVDALDALVVDPSLRRRLAGSARELVLAEHDARRNAGRLVAVLRTAAS